MAKALKRALAALYQGAVALDRARTRPHRLPRPVISVGNLAVGGRGKTPFVIWICRWLQARGRRPVVLTRGYGRSKAAPVWLVGDAPLPSAAAAGDEPLEIHALTGADVLVGPSRRQNAERYLARFDDPQIVFILDDGFQHWKLARDFDLVLVEPADLADSVLPAGRLREPAAALARAQLVLARGRDFEKISELAAPLPPGARAAAACTRAPDPAYRREIARLAPAARVVELADHAPASALRAALAAEREVTHWLLGAKEAAKLWEGAALQDFLRQGRALGEAGGPAFHYVACRLELRTDALATRLGSWLDVS